MTQTSPVPCLPENAPFTAEQRAYLNGFLAGLFSRAAAPNPAADSSPAKALIPLTILFGSQTGTAEGLAKRAAREAGKRGFAATVLEMNSYPADRLSSERRVMVIASTYGDGEPPDGARSFWDALRAASAPRLDKVAFAICALGDSNYPKFCGFGKELDARLETLGGRRISPRVDCDADYEASFTEWLGATLAQFAQTDSPAAASNAVESATTSNGSPEAPAASPGAASPQRFSRSNPFHAPLVVNRHLNGSGSGKETRHFEFDLEGSGMTYEAGDALGVIPSNCPELVDELLSVLGFTGGEAAPGRAGAAPVRDALLRDYEITKIPQPLLRVMAERTRDDLLMKLSQPGVNGELTRFLWGRDIIDLLRAHPEIRFTPIEFVGLLKKMSPRLYSISSSPKAHGGRVHLTVNVLRYESMTRRRKGVCSTFLADRAAGAPNVPLFVHTNRNFRPPSDPATAMIMIGPGTGIAPFRGFLHERSAVNAKGRNWLFFGDQRAATDFMYREELELLRERGILTRLDTAFSRDQSEKVYVQHRMLEHSRELFAWLEEGAHFYVCGDASRMAKDVDAALHQIVRTAGGCSDDAAREYVAKLKSDKRYQRDVY